MDSKEQSFSKNTIIYFFCQSINLTAAILSVSVSAIVGEALSPVSGLGTIPYGAQFLALLLATYPISVFMEKYGRKAGFYLGALCLLFSGVVGFYAVTEKSFGMLVLSHSLIGIFSGCATFYRFAAVDGVAPQFQPRIMSLVIAGGVLAAIVGPHITIYLKDLGAFPMFSLCYGVLSILGMMSIALIFFSSVTQEKKTTDHISFVDHRLPPLTGTMKFSIASAALGYGLMNLFMMQSTIHMHHSLIPFDDSSIAIQWHVLAMFAPSFFSGILFEKVGHSLLISLGYFLFLCALIINIAFEGYVSVFSSLIILGVAWNFSYVGGSALLSKNLVGKTGAKKVQGVADTTIALFALLGAALPSVFIATLGWKLTNGIFAVVVVAYLIIMGLRFYSKKDLSRGSLIKDSLS